MRLLVTRPEPDAARTAHMLRTRGHEVMVAPLLGVEPIAADLGGVFAGVLMTSANAVRVLAAHERFSALRSIPAFTVGGSTAAAAREAGFAQVESAQGALPDLVSLVAARFAGEDSRLLYLAGQDRAGDLAGELSRSGLIVETRVVYRAVAVDAFPPDAARALAAGELDGVLHYSRRSAVALLRVAAETGILNAVLSLAHYVLSAEIAVPLREAGAGRITVAPRPDEAALIGSI